MTQQILMHATWHRSFVLIAVVSYYSHSETIESWYVHISQHFVLGPVFKSYYTCE
jgi:hypothetical protein